MDSGATEGNGCCRPKVQPTIDRGEPLPLGAHRCCAGLNLAIVSRHAAKMELLLFDEATQKEPTTVLPLDPARHRTGDVWHVRLTDGFGRYYAFRLPGAASDHLDPERALLDPYASAVLLPNQGRGARALVIDQQFDWQDTRPPRHSWADTIIYEAHVRGLTAHASAAVANPGQFAGVVEKIPYFKMLGITAVELLPIQAFDPLGISRRNPLSGEPLRDYWGYNPIALFAPEPSYAGPGAAGNEVVAVKRMVRELHRADIEVILDVVFNHTGEGGAGGPTYSFRRLDNAIYYLLGGAGNYLDYTGCGNTLNCNHPVVRTMIIDCLRHWVMHFHIDGFRFDLASVLGRDQDGRLLRNPPLLEQIAEDPILRDTKLIAEAWDAGGAFQVGHFPGRRWAEWNCHYRDDVRRFWRGDPGFTGAFATRLTGSSDLYQRTGESPLNSVNFVTSHDGFTLSDLVSYGAKHNEANGEENRDGMDANYSDNNGIEGPTSDPHVERRRVRQIKNHLAALLLSRGVPMLLGGDEFRRSQGGNNNAYCQDIPISWFDWSLAERNADLVRFVQDLISLRKTHKVLRAERFYRDDEVTWLGPDGQSPQWEGSDNCVGCMVADDESALCLLFNAAPAPKRFVLPDRAGGGWQVAICTAEAAPVTTRTARGGEGVELESRTTTVFCWQRHPEAQVGVPQQGRSQT